MIVHKTTIRTRCLAAILATASVLLPVQLLYAQNTDVTERQTTASFDSSGLQNRHPLSSPRAVVIDGLAVGDQLDEGRMHIITRPGLYGLTGSVTTQSRYGIIDGKLLRFDPETMQLRAIIRSGVLPLE